MKKFVRIVLLVMVGIAIKSASGPLMVRQTQSGYVMNFPRRYPVSATSPSNLAEALGTVPVEVLSDTFNYIAVLKDAQKYVPCHRTFRRLLIWTTLEWW